MLLRHLIFGNAMIIGFLLLAVVIPLGAIAVVSAFQGPVSFQLLVRAFDRCERDPSLARVRGRQGVQVAGGVEPGSTIVVELVHWLGLEGEVRAVRPSTPNQASCPPLR
jgi:hypothetical protein